MPYNPGIQALPLGGQTDQRATYNYQKYSGVGDSISKGIQEYRKNQFIANQSLAEFQAIASLPVNQDMIQHLVNDPGKTGKIYRDLLEGKNLSAEASAMLAGYAKATVAGKEMVQKNQLMNAQMEDLRSQAAYRTTESAKMTAYINALNSAANGGDQGQAPAGSPQGSAPAGQTEQPQSQATGLSNPEGFSLDPRQDEQIFRAQSARSASLPDASALNTRAKNRAEWLNADQPVGAGAPPVYEYDNNGYATNKVIYPLVQKPRSPGKYFLGKDPIKIAPNQASPMPLIDPNTGKRIADNANAPAPFNPNAPGNQEAIGQAIDNTVKTQHGLSQVKFLKDAIDSYTNNPTDLTGWKSLFATDDRLNAVFGTEVGAKVKQVMTGTNPAAQIHAALGLMYGEMINELRNDKTGSNALRQITQQELSQLQSQFGKPDMPNYVLKALAQNTFAAKERDYQRQYAYTELLKKGLSPVAAKDKVFSDPVLGKPIDLQVAKDPSAQPVPGVTKMVEPKDVPSRYSALLYEHANDPAYTQAFDKRFGPGAAQYFLSLRGNR